MSDDIVERLRLRVKELESLIDSALEHVSDIDKLEADHNNNHFRSNYK